MRPMALLSVVLALTGGVDAGAQARGQGTVVNVPNFTGEWIYQVPSRGNNGGRGGDSPRVGGLEGGGYTNWGPAAPMLIITQTATEMTLDRGLGRPDGSTSSMAPRT